MEPEGIPPEEVKAMSEEQREELDARARKGETVVRGGTGGYTVDSQLRLAEGRSKGGQTRREEMSHEAYSEMGRKGGLTTTEKSAEQRIEEEGINIDESKYKKT